MVSVYLREKKGKRGTSLFLAYWLDGRWRYRFLKMRLIGERLADKETKRRAEAYRVELERQLNLGIAGEFDLQQNFVALFEELSLTQNYQSVLKLLKEFVGKKPLRVRSVTPGFYEEFQDFILTKVALITARNYISIFRAVCNRIQRRGWEANPVKKIPKLKVKENGERVFLTMDELTAMAKAECKNAELKRFFMFASFSGLRVSDCRALTWGKISKSNSGYQLAFIQRKTGEATYLPLHPEAVRWLFEGQSEKIKPMPDQPVFKLPLSMTTVEKDLNLWARAAKISKHVTAHTARHTFAMAGASAGVDVFAMMKLLGHSNISATQVYYRMLPERMRSAIDMIPGLSKSTQRDRGTK